MTKPLLIIVFLCCTGCTAPNDARRLWRITAPPYINKDLWFGGFQPKHVYAAWCHRTKGIDTVHLWYEGFRWGGEDKAHRQYKVVNVNTGRVIIDRPAPHGPLSDVAAPPDGGKVYCANLGIGPDSGIKHAVFGQRKHVSISSAGHGRPRRTIVKIGEHNYSIDCELAPGTRIVRYDDDEIVFANEISEMPSIFGSLTVHARDGAARTINLPRGATDVTSNGKVHLVLGSQGLTALDRDGRELWRADAFPGGGRFTGLPFQMARYCVVVGERQYQIRDTATGAIKHEGKGTIDGSGVTARKSYVSFSVQGPDNKIPGFIPPEGEQFLVFKDGKLAHERIVRNFHTTLCEVGNTVCLTGKGFILRLDTMKELRFTGDAILISGEILIALTKNWSVHAYDLKPLMAAQP